MTPAEFDDLAAEFACGCSIRTTPELSISLWQCTAGEDCQAWRLISAGLEQLMRQLRIFAIILPGGRP